MTFDALIVLSNYMDKNGVLNEESKLRALKAIETYNDKQINYIITTGWNYRDDTNINISDSFKEFILSNSSIKREKIISDPNSRDTVGDAFFTKKNIIKPKNLKNICIVTSDWHIKRTSMIFNFIYGKDYLLKFIETKTSRSHIFQKNEKNSLNTFIKTFIGIERGNDKEIEKVLFTKHPFYNGRLIKKNI